MSIKIGTILRASNNRLYKVVANDGRVWVAIDPDSNSYYKFTSKLECVNADITAVIEPPATVTFGKYSWNIVRECDSRYGMWSIDPICSLVRKPTEERIPKALEAGNLFATREEAINALLVIQAMRFGAWGRNEDLSVVQRQDDLLIDLEENGSSLCMLRDGTIAKASYYHPPSREVYAVRFDDLPKLAKFELSEVEFNIGYQWSICHGPVLGSFPLNGDTGFREFVDKPCKLWTLDIDMQPKEYKFNPGYHVDMSLLMKGGLYRVKASAEQASKAIRDILIGRKQF